MQKNFLSMRVLYAFSHFIIMCCTLHKCCAPCWCSFCYLENTFEYIRHDYMIYMRSWRANWFQNMWTTKAAILAAGGSMQLMGHVLCTRGTVHRKISIKVTNCISQTEKETTTLSGNLLLCRPSFWLSAVHDCDHISWQTDTEADTQTAFSTVVHIPIKQPQTVICGVGTSCGQVNHTDPFPPTDWLSCQFGSSTSNGRCVH